MQTKNPTLQTRKINNIESLFLVCCAGAIHKRSARTDDDADRLIVMTTIIFEMSFQKSLYIGKFPTNGRSAAGSVTQLLSIAYLIVQKWLGNNFDPTVRRWRRIRNGNVPVKNDCAPAPPGQEIFCKYAADGQ